MSGPFCIGLPLSPTHLFVVADTDAVMRRLERLDRTELVKIMNRSIVTAASKYVYGVDSSHLPLAEKWLR